MAQRQLIGALFIPADTQLAATAGPQLLLEVPPPVAACPQLHNMQLPGGSLDCQQPGIGAPSQVVDCPCAESNTCKLYLADIDIPAFIKDLDNQQLGQLLRANRVDNYSQL